MTVKLLTDQHLELLSLKGGCPGWSESILFKMHIVGNHMSRLITIKVKQLTLTLQVRASLTLQETRSIHDSMNLPNIEFNAYIHILL